MGDRQHVKAAFSFWDADKSGFLSSDELFHILAVEFKEDCTQNEVKDILLEVDTDGSGRVDEAELLDLLSLKE
eukprot:JP444218.1.p3 GENE.JP444218.1~~JP444218.1.p3  ORF type:complete len:73 (-),score=33.86 JP444218.1:24-242(-)